MPLLDSALAQVIFAFVMIGLFAFVLRWTFSGGASLEKDQSDDEGAAGAGPIGDVYPALGTDPVAATGAMLGNPLGPPRVEAHADQPRPSTAPATDDYGLLAPAAIVDTAEQAARTRELLSRAGIRATTTIGSDGRRRVLVFARDLDRARRVAGSSG